MILEIIFFYLCYTIVSLIILLYVKKVYNIKMIILSLVPFGIILVLFQYKNNEIYPELQSKNNSPKNNSPESILTKNNFMKSDLTKLDVPSSEHPNYYINILQ